MSLTSCEIRWFVRQCPFALDEMFDQPAAERTDWYAPVAESTTGIKIREGRIEAKLMTQEMGLAAISGCQGSMHRWEKWSAVVDTPLPTERQLREAGWVAVKKRRYITVWSTETTPLRMTHDRVAQGAQFEVTELHVHDQRWWTIGFESFGPERTQAGSLEALITHVLGEYSSKEALTAADSMAYPEWLQSL